MSITSKLLRNFFDYMTETSVISWTTTFEVNVMCAPSLTKKVRFSGCPYGYFDDYDQYVSIRHSDYLSHVPHEGIDVDGVWYPPHQIHSIRVVEVELDEDRESEVPDDEGL